MIVKEFGNSNASIVMMLHGGGLPLQSCHDVANLLANEGLHVVLPAIDGHGASDAPFISIEQSALKIIRYIDLNYNGHVKLIAGFSLGGQILVEILSKRKDICDFAFIESANVIPFKLSKLMMPAIKLSHKLIKYKWFSHMQFKSYGIDEKLFNDFYNDNLKLTYESLTAIIKANAAYALNPDIKDCRARVYIAAGDRELKSITASAKLLHESITCSKLEIIKNYSHGDLSINHPSEYRDRIINLINS